MWTGLSTHLVQEKAQNVYRIISSEVARLVRGPVLKCQRPGSMATRHSQAKGLQVGQGPPLKDQRVFSLTSPRFSGRPALLGPILSPHSFRSL